jgi:hypothetical protein
MGLAESDVVADPNYPGHISYYGKSNPLNRAYRPRTALSDAGPYSASLTDTCKRLGRGERSASRRHEPMPRRPFAKLS